MPVCRRCCHRQRHRALHRADAAAQVYAKEYDNMLVVGATTEYDEWAPFSNYDNQLVHLSAPGTW